MRPAQSSWILRTHTSGGAVLTSTPWSCIQQIMLQFQRVLPRRCCGLRGPPGGIAGAGVKLGTCDEQAAAAAHSATTVPRTGHSSSKSRSYFTSGFFFCLLERTTLATETASSCSIGDAGLLYTAASICGNHRIIVLGAEARGLEIRDDGGTGGAWFSSGEPWGLEGEAPAALGGEPAPTGAQAATSSGYRLLPRCHASASSTWAPIGRWT